MDGRCAFLLLSFGPGLTTLLISRVFPMIPLTVSFFSPDGDIKLSGIVPLEGREGKTGKNYIIFLK